MSCQIGFLVSYVGPSLLTLSAVTSILFEPPASTSSCDNGCRTFNGIGEDTDATATNWSISDCTLYIFVVGDNR